MIKKEEGRQMILSYEQFLENNRTSRNIQEKATIIGVHYSVDMVTCINTSGERITLPIPILVLDMENGMCHINDASRLKSWNKWGTNIDYPEDYFEYPDKYITMMNREGN